MAQDHTFTGPEPIRVSAESQARYEWEVHYLEAHRDADAAEAEQAYARFCPQAARHYTMPKVADETVAKAYASQSPQQPEVAFLSVLSEEEILDTAAGGRLNQSELRLRFLDWLRARRGIEPTSRAARGEWERFWSRAQKERAKRAGLR